MKDQDPDFPNRIRGSGPKKMGPDPQHCLLRKKRLRKKYIPQLFLFFCNSYLFLIMKFSLSLFPVLFAGYPVNPNHNYH